MKNVILMALLCMGFFSAQAQNEFTIQGKVKGLKDGTVVTLFRTEGNVGSSIANDTVKNESFFFKEKAEDQEIGKYLSAAMVRRVFLLWGWTYGLLREQKSTLVAIIPIFILGR